MKCLKDKTVWYWFGILAAACAAFVAVFGPMTQGLAWDRWDAKITILLLAGVAAELICFFLDFDFLCLVPALLYSAALIFVVNGVLLVILDYIRQINWVNGNYGNCVLYLALSLGACILTTVRCFLQIRKAPSPVKVIS